MGFIKKNKFEIIASVLIVLIYFITRLTTLTILPIFTDEAIYLRWAQIASHDTNWRFISLTDGKQPLFIWVTMIIMKFIQDPLISGRLVSVFAGVFSLTGIFFLTRALFRSKICGLIAAMLYVIYPFALVYDRMALYDGLVGTFTVWGLYFSVRTVRTLRLDNAMILGITGGLGVLNKSNAFFIAYLIPFTLILFDWKKQGLVKRILHYIVLAGISIVFIYAIYSILRLSPFFYIIAQKDSVFIYPLKEWIKHPFANFWGNFWLGQGSWLIEYFTLPLFLLIPLGFIFGKPLWKEKLYLLLWFFVPFIALALFGKVIYPRYIFFMTLPLLPICAFSIYKIFINKRSIFMPLVITGIIIGTLIWKDFYIIYDFTNAPIPQSDRNQYLNDWPSGIGVKESIKYLKNFSKGRQIVLYTQGTFGLMPQAYEVFLYGEKWISIDGLWPINFKIPDKLLDSARTKPTFIAFFQPCANCPAKGIAPVSWPLEKALQIQKPSGDAVFTLYRVKPQ